MSESAKDTIGLYNEIWENFSLIIEGDLSVNEMNAYQIEFITNLNNQTLRFKIVVVQKENLSAAIIYQASLNIFEDYLSDFEESLNSLVLI